MASKMLNEFNAILHLFPKFDMTIDTSSDEEIRFGGN